MATRGKRGKRERPTEPQVGILGDLRLVVVAGGQIGQRIKLQGERMLVGRLNACDISLEHPKISRRHAEIVELGPQRFAVRDLGSQNGTFVNGSRVDDERVLRIGDKIRFGTEVVVRVSIHDPIEEQLRERQRFEALGRATAGIAHDFNNLLGAMIANLGFLQTLDESKPLGSDDVAETLTDVRGAAKRASELSDRLLHFARGERAKDMRVTVPTVFAEVAQLVRRTFDRKIAVETHCDDNLAVSGDGLELHQVLMNLCLNARDAMPNGGTLTLRGRDGEGGMVVISVEDDGVGMDASTRAQIFHPFFSTKHERGYGLGLATVREIVLSLGGEINVTSRPAAGTRFDILLPSAAAAERKPEPRPPARTIVEDSGRELIVMVVDDEATVRRSMRRVLAQSGHTVIEAENGLVAVERYRAGPKPDVVVLDVDMPGLSGEDTIGRLREIDSNAVVVMMSGHRDTVRESRFRKAGTAAFLRKPASMQEIIDTVETAASRDSEPPGTERGFYSVS